MRHSPFAMYPRTAAFTALYERLGAPVERLDLAGIRRSRGVVYPQVPPFSWITGGVDRSVGVTFGTAPARDGYDIPLRLYRPRRLRDTETDVPVVLFFHGGGWVQGNVVMYDPLCMHLAEQVRAVVVSVDYRLAPEHPAPLAAHDAIDATRWVAGHGAVLRADTCRLAVCGDSAGGNLAAVVAQALRDDHAAGTSPHPPPGPDLPRDRHDHVVPVDRRARRRTDAHQDEHARLPRPLLPRRLVLRRPARLARSSVTSTDLPPALIQTADLDPLRDDGTRYADALRAAGVPVRLTNYLRVPHGFASFPGVVATGAQHRAELVGELRTHLYAAHVSPDLLGG